MDVYGSMGYAGKLGATGGGIGLGGVWHFLSARVSVGYTAGKRGKALKDGYREQNGKCYAGGYEDYRGNWSGGSVTDAYNCIDTQDFTILTGEAELLFGDHAGGSFVGGFGGRLGFPNTPFAAIGYTLPSSKGAVSGILHLGYRLATVNFQVSFTPDF